MFDRNSKKQKKKLESFDSLVGSSTRILGRLIVHKSIRIDGEITGNVEKHDNSEDISIALGNTGKVHGNITATDVFVAGVVTGTIYALGKVELAETAHVYGDIHYTLIEIAEGAQIYGTLLQAKDKVFRPNFKLE